MTVRVEPEEVGGSVWLESHKLSNLGIHLKQCDRCNQRCQFQLVFAFLLVNALGDRTVLEALFSTMGITTST